MEYTDPPDYLDFQTVRSSVWNKAVRDNLRFLYTAIGFRYSVSDRTFIRPTNEEQLLIADPTGSDPYVSGGAYTVSYLGDESDLIPWNATDNEIETIMRGSMPILIVPRPSPVPGTTQLGVSVTGDELSSGFTFAFDSGIYEGADVALLVATDVSLSYLSHRFDGDLVFSTATPGDDFAKIFFSVADGTRDFSTGGVTPDTVGSFPGLWEFHTTIDFQEQADTTFIVFRLNGDEVARAAPEPPTTTVPRDHGVADLTWIGEIEADDVFSVHVNDQDGTAVIGQANSPGSGADSHRTYFEGIFRGGV